jgi:hypothetical protein
MRSSTKPELNRINLRTGAAICALFLCLLWISGCGTQSGATTTPLPTLTLLPATATPTDTPILPTETVAPRTAPDALQPTEANETTLVPASVQSLVSRAVDDLARELVVERTAVTLIEIKAATWRSLDLGCGEEPALSGTSVEIPGYRLVFEVQNETYAYHTDTDDTVRRCDRPDVVAGQTSALLDVDPIAAELTILAQRQVANQREIALEAVEVVSVRAYRWPDASLGCPLEGNTYTDVEIDGYRIVLRVDDDEINFHTNFEQIFVCEAENARLPDQ